MSYKTFTQKDFFKIPRKNISADEAFIFFGRFPITNMTKERLEELPNGTYLGVHQNEKREMTRLYMKNIWIKKIELPYSATPGSRKGKELLISNFKI